MELRTNQQLGYIVASGAFSRDDYSAMYCIVQSDGYPPHEVESRSIKFLSNAINDLDNLSNEELKTYKFGRNIRNRKRDLMSFLDSASP